MSGLRVRNAAAERHGGHSLQRSPRGQQSQAVADITPRRQVRSTANVATIVAITLRVMSPGR
ncbi:MAG TPA: hypothetical protein VGI40_01440 [Pirellulaceae bacterium]